MRWCDTAKNTAILWQNKTSQFIVIMSHQIIQCSILAHAYCMSLCLCLLSCLCRYEDTGYSAPRYSAYVRQCPPAVLFCVLYIRHCWGAALGWSSKEQVFPGQQHGVVSTFIFCSLFAFLPALSPSLLECVRVSDVICSDSQFLPSAMTFQVLAVL